jgi:hypothetical protein
MNPLKLLLLAAFVSSGAGAQSAGCVTVDGQLICPKERTNSETENWANQMVFQKQVNEARAAAKARRKAEQEGIAKEQSLKEQVGQLIAEGNCPAAYETALRAGDLNLASQVKGICSSAQR